MKIKNQTPNNKHDFFSIEKFNNSILIGDVTRGECDFDHSPAVQGRKSKSTDTFYLCEEHADRLQSKR